MNGQEACDSTLTNCGTENLCDAVIYSPQGLKFKRLTITTAGEDAGEELIIADGTQNI